MMNMITTHPRTPETEEIDQLRADIYALLGSLLHQAPTTDLIEWLSNLEPESQNNKMATAWSALALTARHSQETSIHHEYHDLFIGVGRGELMPFGCWYLTGSLMERPLVVLREDLKQLGYERQSDVHEPEDHIAALCEVASLMIQQGYGYSPQLAFLERHIFPWANRFFADLQRAKCAVFYAPVGLLGETFLQQERAYFQQLSPAQLGNTETDNNNKWGEPA